MKKISEEGYGIYIMQSDEDTCSNTQVKYLYLLYEAYLRISFMIRERVFLCFTKFNM